MALGPKPIPETGIKYGPLEVEPATPCPVLNAGELSAAKEGDAIPLRCIVYLWGGLIGGCCYGLLKVEV